MLNYGVTYIFSISFHILITLFEWFDSYYIKISLLTFIKRYGNEAIKIFFIFIIPISCCVCISLTSKPTYLSQKNLKSLRKTFFCVILCSVVNLRKFFLNDVELLFVLHWKRAKILKSIYVQHSNWTSNMTSFYRPMVHSQQTIRFCFHWTQLFRVMIYRNIFCFIRLNIRHSEEIQVDLLPLI